CETVFLIRQNEKRSFARKASCGAVRLTAKPVHFLHLNNFVAKTVHFKDHRSALHCKQSSVLFLPLRLALRIKAVPYFAAPPADDASAYQIQSRI
ncbi:hypothetical protein, partial [Acinetobacter sp.]|uniref:hypothetical protein n=1 Tax=Acinetobacter sp. TaxID=472 RepID=UPI0035B21C4E